MSKKKKKKQSPAANHSRPLLHELEPRVLLSADAQSALVDPDLGQAPGDPEPAAQLALFDSEAAATQDAVQVRHELVIIDPGAEDAEQLSHDLRNANSSSRQVDVIVRDAERDGIEQISEILTQYDNLDAFHIVSHGSNGSVQLGNTSLTGDNLDTHASELTSWSDALRLDADLLFYGCDLAGDASGKAFVESIATPPGAGRAARGDATAAAPPGGGASGGARCARSTPTRPTRRPRTTTATECRTSCTPGTRTPLSWRRSSRV